MSLYTISWLWTSWRSLCGFWSFEAWTLRQHRASLSLWPQWCHKGRGAGPTLDNLRTTSLLPRPTVLERKPHRRPRSAASCSRTHAERRRRTAEVRRGNWPAGWHHHSITCTAAQSHLVTSSPAQLLSHTWWHHHLLSHTWALYLRHISGQLLLKGHSGDFQRFL